jgi:ketol-acid reductoisomerase
LSLLFCVCGTAGMNAAVAPIRSLGCSLSSYEIQCHKPMVIMQMQLVSMYFLQCGYTYMWLQCTNTAKYTRLHKYCHYIEWNVEGTLTPFLENMHIGWDVKMW